MVPATSSIYSIDILLYPYALPSIQFPYSFSRLCLSCNLSYSKRGAIGQTYQQNETALPVGKQNTCSVNYEKPKRVQEEQTR